ncbi:MAG TPA: hypothetical protein VMR06_07380, partial [Dokdonella sp.]|uniref:winged helix-turn-helix domain-containing protein n=1 Tax=Dokdonella sp. TaxID=2291710 RepID=UPI002C471ED6|nr:hypothetical protein [Dokdonella sp.]
MNDAAKAPELAFDHLRQIGTLLHLRLGIGLYSEQKPSGLAGDPVTLHLEHAVCLRRVYATHPARLPGSPPPAWSEDGSCTKPDACDRAATRPSDARTAPALPLKLSPACTGSGGFLAGARVAGKIGRWRQGTIALSMDRIWNAEPSQRYRFGNVVVETRGRRVFVDGHERRVPRRVFDLLLLLCRAPRRVIPRDALYEALWSGGQI